MTKLAFSSLLFFTLYSTLHFSSLIFASPVNSASSSLWSEGMQREAIAHHYDYDELNHHVDNRVDRSEPTSFKYDLNAGNQDKSDREIIRPSGRLREDLVEPIKAKVVWALRVSDYEAEQIVRNGFHNLSEDDQNAVLSRSPDTYKPACEKMKDAADL